MLTLVCAIAAAPTRGLHAHQDTPRASGRACADLLLVDGNPLEDLSRLKSPAGVMVRGTWLPRDRLQGVLAALRASR